MSRLDKEGLDRRHILASLLQNHKTVKNIQLTKHVEDKQPSHHSQGGLVREPNPNIFTNFQNIFIIYVISRGACNPLSRLARGGLCLGASSVRGAQSCRRAPAARRCVRRWAIENPPLPSSWVRTIITCL